MLKRKDVFLKLTCIFLKICNMNILEGYILLFCLLCNVDFIVNDHLRFLHILQKKINNECCFIHLPHMHKTKWLSFWKWHYRWNFSIQLSFLQLLYWIVRAQRGCIKFLWKWVFLFTFLLEFCWNMLAIECCNLHQQLLHKMNFEKFTTFTIISLARTKTIML